MPRLSRSLLRHAHSLHSLLPPLLQTCRDLTSARNELRWLLQHAKSLSKDDRSGSTGYGLRTQLRQFVYQRKRGKPLQYILGSHPFGDLDILCRAGVLIPRPETESLTSHLATILPRFLGQEERLHGLRILDLCTGSGCIPLHLHSLHACRTTEIQCCGVDVSAKAIHLAKQNRKHNVGLQLLRPSVHEEINFIQDDIFSDKGKAWANSTWDVLVSNPPYISPDAFNKTTSRSVRNFEPKIALVPHQNKMPSGLHKSDHEIGDIFYPRLLQIAHQVGARVLLTEVADMAQAQRVALMVVDTGIWEGCEIWRDWPAQGNHDNNETVGIAGTTIRVRGQGNGRAVLAWRNCGDELTIEQQV